MPTVPQLAYLCFHVEEQYLRSFSLWNEVQKLKKKITLNDKKKLGQMVFGLPGDRIPNCPFLSLILAYETLSPSFCMNFSVTLSVSIFVCLSDRGSHCLFVYFPVCLSLFLSPSQGRPEKSWVPPQVPMAGLLENFSQV